VPTPEKVIFRFWDGSVIAIFPEIASDPSPYHCQSYMHMGQHASCEPHGIIQESRLAKPEEYEPLARELTGRGYNLAIIKRLRHYTIEIRRQQLKGIA
jgi:hypothetical protein